MPNSVINGEAHVEGALSTYRNLSLDATGVAVKAAPGRLYAVHIENRAASERFVKLYNLATGPSGSDTPMLTLSVPASSPRAFGISAGLRFDAGIGIRATTGIADNNAGAPSANDIVVHVFYQ